MATLPLRFSYLPDDGTHALSAYDAATALYGISRSTAIVAHYVANNKIIKQAPSLKNVQIFVRPPQPGSFEFWVDIAPAVGLGLATNFLSDLLKYLYRRASGLKELPKTPELSEVLYTKSGEIDSLSDAIEEDVVRIHRPLEAKNVQIFNIYGGTQHFGSFNGTTYDYAKTKTRGSIDEEFIGNVASLNANTINGRFWLADEERTIGFNQDKDTKLPKKERGLLAWSLNEYANGRSGHIKIVGIPLRSKQGLLKRVFVKSVSVS